MTIKIRATLALLAAFATGIASAIAEDTATNRPPVQTFYLPIPEENLLQSLTSIHGLEDLGYFHMKATPPYNEAEIDLDGADARFFKIRVDNLTNEARYADFRQEWRERGGWEQPPLSRLSPGP